MKPVMKNKLSIFIFVCLFVTAGCKINYEAESIVSDDGSITRTTIFRVVDKEDENILQDLYELSQDGVWVELQRHTDQSKKAEPTKSYTIKKNFSLTQQPASDFKRFNKSKDKFARNEFSVKVKDFWIVKFFHYDEKFIDIVDNKKREKILRQIFEDSLSEFRSQLSSEIKDERLIGQIREQLRIKLEPLLDQSIDIINKFGWDSNKLDEISEFKDEQEFNKFVTDFLEDQFPELRNEISRDLVINSLNKISEIMGEKYQYFEEELFGVHGFNIFDTYDFEISVQMPGTVIRTNANKMERGSLTWNFSSGNLSKDLVADSRKFYPGRWIIIISVLLSIITIILKRKIKIMVSKNNGVCAFNVLTQ